MRRSIRSCGGTKRKSTGLRERITPTTPEVLQYFGGCRWPRKSGFGQTPAHITSISSYTIKAGKT
jgi:hypothetical protein